MAHRFEHARASADGTIRAGAARATPRTDDEVRQLLRLLPRYRVLLHASSALDPSYVTATLARTIPALTLGHAARIAVEARARGRAEVIVCFKEPAEHYREGLRRQHLTCTIEPA